MSRYFNKILRPECYHGQHGKKPFFEGWYYKLTDANGKRSLAIIPGVFLDADMDSSEAFVQIIDSKENRSHYVAFSAEAFRYVEGVFDIGIDWNRFTDSHIHLDIHLPELQLTGNLTFTDLTPWPITLFSPGAMGWYAWIPFMECFHGILSLDHKIDGTLEMNGQTLDLNGGHGYTEKDWGQAFPQAWFWVQCNHFPTTGTSLTGSLAIIPWIRRPFPGFIWGLWHDGRLHRFTTYSRSALKNIEWKEDRLSVSLENRTHWLDVEVRPGHSLPLKAPDPGGMERIVHESLDTRVSILLTEKNGAGKKAIINESGTLAGFEAGGDADHLIAMCANLVRSRSYG